MNQAVQLHELVIKNWRHQDRKFEIFQCAEQKGKNSLSHSFSRSYSDVVCILILYAFSSAVQHSHRSQSHIQCLLPFCSRRLHHKPLPIFLVDFHSFMVVFFNHRYWHRRWRNHLENIFMQFCSIKILNTLESNRRFYYCKKYDTLYKISYYGSLWNWLEMGSRDLWVA